MKIPDVILIRPKIIEDTRGYFYETFLQQKLDKIVGSK